MGCALIMQIYSVYLLPIGIGISEIAHLLALVLSLAILDLRP